MSIMFIPQKLKKGDTIRVIAPARSLSIVGSNIDIAVKKREEYGIHVTFSKHCLETDDFNSSSIESRIQDLHEAFLDTNIQGIFTAIGGYNSNQLLKYIDYGIIKNNPKILCGFSDITVLSNAIYKKTGMISYSGPHFSTWAMEKEFEYNLEYFEKCLIESDAYEIKPSKTRSDDMWFIDQKNRNIIDNEGYRVINEGKAEGTIIGGHTRCLAALQGTEYMPSLDDSILFIEEDEEINRGLFDRLIQSLIQLPEFAGVKGIVIGRFQNASKIDKSIITQIIRTKKELAKIPVIANANFGHTNPICTFPIGGFVKIVANTEGASIEVTQH